jgi:hypothetical protein
MQEELERALEAVLHRMTHGGWDGNPYACPEVKHGLRLLCRIQGCRAWFDVKLRPLEEKKEGER